MVFQASLKFDHTYGRHNFGVRFKKIFLAYVKALNLLSQTILWVYTVNNNATL